MTEETKKAFTAPWHSNLKDDYVEDAKGFVIAKCLSNPITNCIARLPELYDALKGAVQEACGTCAMMHINPDTYDFVEKGCPFIGEHHCDYRDCIAILRKVREGK